MSGPRVVLVGPPGAGKTSVGRIVARALGVSFRDTDEDVSQAFGKPIPDIFVDDGEAAFRDAEHVAVVAALAGHDGVLALGGGAVQNPEIRALLAAPTVAFLDVSLSAAVERVGLARDRPLLLGSPRSVLKQLMDRRRPMYEEVATVTVDTSECTVDEVAHAVLAAVRQAEHA